MDEIKTLLYQAAALLELSGENPFRIRAYNTAAEIAESYSGDLESFVADCNSGAFKGIGPQLRESIMQIYERGTFSLLEDLKKQFPPNILELLEIRGLGPKKVRQIYEEFKVEGIAGLKKLCLEQQLRTLKGFSEKSEAKILAAIAEHYANKEIFLFSEAKQQAEELRQLILSQYPQANLAEVAELRRFAPALSSIELALGLSLSDFAKLSALLANDTQVAAAELSSASLIQGQLGSGLLFKLKQVEPTEWVFRVWQLSGSAEHVAQVLKRTEASATELQTLQSEEEIYNAGKLCFIPPSCRESGEEITVAAEAFKHEAAFPPCLTKQDLLGFVHAHSTYSDGRHSLEEMALAALNSGYQYFGISDHSQSATYANGLSTERVVKQQEEIQTLNTRLSPFKILSGIEADILSDGSLDYSPQVLESFDFVIAAIHSRFSMPRAEMTERIIRAIANPQTNILAHPSGRLLGSRKGYELDYSAIFKAAAEHRVAIEINCSKRRLDLDWTLLRQALELGVYFSLGPDAHSINGIADLELGLLAAAKAWLPAERVLNTFSEAQLSAFFAKQ